MENENKNNNWGGARKGSGRKKLPPELKKDYARFYVTPDEKEKLKAYLQLLRSN